MNKQQAIERLKGIVDFYKLNDENNYDYSDEVLISMRITLEEIERLNKRIEDLNIINEEHRELNGMIRKELKKKENIIKEAKEYIEHNYFVVGRIEKIYKILDKGSDKE